MPGDSTRPVLILFAKAPVPGQVKTRLVPKLNPDQAAQLAAELIKLTLRLAVDSWPGPLVLCTSPDTDHPLFRKLVNTYPVALAGQGSGNLGRRMNAAIRKHTKAGIPAAVMGCDVPHCPAQTLHQACDLLERGRDIIGPSPDGGYYLIGLQRPHAQIFGDVDWGSSNVMRTTLANARECGVRFEHLPPLQDLDRYSDLVEIAEVVPDLRKWLA